MAGSGTIRGSWNGAASSVMTLRCDWTSVEIPAQNKSTVTLKWIATRTTSSQQTYKNNAPWSRTLGGTVTINGTQSFDIRNTAVDADYVYLTQVIDVTHENDGTKVFAISGTIDLSGTSAGVGSFSGSITLPVIATTPPTVDSLTATDSTRGQIGGVPSAVSDMVGGYTKITLTATATPASPATIASFAFYSGSTLLATVASSGSGQQTASWTYPSANAAGTYNFKVVVTDSFGNSTTSSVVSVTVKAYRTPTLRTETYRCSLTGSDPSSVDSYTPDPSGTYLHLGIDATIANLTGNTAVVRKTEVGNNTYNWSYNTASRVEGGFPITNSYLAVYTVTDVFGNSAIKKDFVPADTFGGIAIYPSNLGGVGFGTLAKEGLFSCMYPAEFMDDVAVEGALIVGGSINAPAPIAVTAGIVNSVSGLTLKSQAGVHFGRVASITISVYGSLSNNAATMGTIASGWRPPTGITASGVATYSNSTIIAALESDGTLIIKNNGSAISPTNSSPLKLNLTYIVGN